MDKKPTSLVVTADSHNARIFERIGSGKKFDFHLLYEVEAELDSNHEKPGRSFTSYSTFRHAVEPHTDRRQVEKHKFAEEISQILLQLENEKHCDGLILVASHKVLEELEKTLSDKLKKKITHRLAKNLLEFKDQEIEEYLEENL